MSVSVTKIEDYEKETGMTLQGHKNKVLFKLILVCALLVGSVVLLKKQKKLVKTLILQNMMFYCRLENRCRVRLFRDV